MMNNPPGFNLSGFYVGPVPAIHLTQPEDYDPDYTTLKKTISDNIAYISGPLFTTDANPDELWRQYLLNIAPGKRQHYNCNHCQRFIQRYGGLAMITENGNGPIPFLWSKANRSIDQVTGTFDQSLQMLFDLVRNANITGQFLWDGSPWGTARTGKWTHLSGTPMVGAVKHPVLTVDQLIAQQKQCFNVLKYSIAEFNRDAVDRAYQLLSQGVLDRPEKAIEMIGWLMRLYLKLSQAGMLRHHQSSVESTGDLLIWRTVAEAPPGFCNIRNTVAGSLITDIQAGLSLESIVRSWNSKLDPMKYQRPTAALSAGMIDQAEKTIEQLGLVSALNRRYARLDEVQVKYWEPKPVPQTTSKDGGVFVHLRTPTPKTSFDLPEIRITWAKFRDEVLPRTHRLELLLPTIGSFYGLLTAADPESKPILQWDGLEGEPRNPVSWFYINGGSTPAVWSLTGPWVQVNMVFPSPAHWYKSRFFVHHGQQVLFALEGCQHRMHQKLGLALFPEFLRTELRGIRKVIEKHSNTGSIQGDRGTANGIGVKKCDNPRDFHAIHLRSYREDGGSALHTIDRWD